jgi:GNAT superfamily N-acetyltransferase/predicted nucleic acid-binding protein
MSTNPRVEVEIVGSNSLHLPEVKRLGRAHSKTLGMMPDGAFEEYAALKQILGAVNEAGKCVGYVLYRAAKERAMIAHLCVADDWQEKGVSRALVERLVEITKAHGLRGVGLRCRRDYEASRVWPRLGFVPLHDKPGRSLDGKDLTFWWLDHQQPDLFQKTTAEVPEDSRLVVVMDANVFFDLYDDSDPESGESKALMADWLQDAVELCLTDEIYTEINRNQDKQEREHWRAQARRRTIFQPAQSAVSAAEASVRAIFPKALTEKDESDLRQLAKSIAQGVQFFVTRDQPVLKMADHVYEVCGVSILRPTALINQLDTLRRESEYQPVRLGGSRFKTRHIESQDEDRLSAVFQASSKGESAAAFLKCLRTFLASPQTCSCYVAEDEQQQPLAIYGYLRPNASVLEMPLLRAGRNNLAPTVARHLLARALQRSAAEGRTVTTVTEQQLDAVVLTALEESGFSCVDGVWMKLNIGLAGSAHQLASRLDEMAAEGIHVSKLASALSKSLKAWQALPEKAGAVALERALWPAKILDAEVPSFIVPIQPGWAQSLFDEGLANQELFGERPELALKREQVYYRANQKCGLEWPGRILWYVSADSDRQGTMSIRACSRLDEIVVEKPKELFRRFRRLGVYEWRDVYKKAQHDINKLLMALRFSDTETFQTPIRRDWFRKLGIRSNLQSPVCITKEQFAAIYKAGTGKS